MRTLEDEGDRLAREAISDLFVGDPDRVSLVRWKDIHEQLEEAWNLITWWLGLPSSSTHALIGGLVGAALVQSGEKGVQWHGVWEKGQRIYKMAPEHGFCPPPASSRPGCTTR